MDLNSLFESKEAAPVAGQKTLKQALHYIADPVNNPAPVTEDQLTDLTDYDKRRQMFFDNTLKAVQGLTPSKNDRYTLQITDVNYADDKPLTRADYKKAVMEKRTLSRKLTGKYQLIDNVSGEVIKKSGKKTLLNVPYMTEFGTFVRNGTDIAVNNQMRMRPGVYTHFTADGYPEAQFNVKVGTGGGFRTWLDPASSIFYMTMRGRKVPLYPVMKQIGMDDKQIQAAWGEEVFKANKAMETSTHARRWLNEQDERFAKKLEPVADADEDLKEEPTDFGKKDMSSLIEEEVEA